jgi:predicted peptidase
MSSEIHERIYQPGNLRYSLSLPRANLADQPTPLILALHFAGHGAPFYGKLILTELVEPALRELDATILAPDCTGPDWTQPQSESDVLTLLDHILEKHNVDPNRVLITGYSMGGIGTWHLASRHQERFSGALIMAGLPPANITDVDWKIPFYIIQSRDDQFMPVAPTQEAVEGLKAAGTAVELVLLDGITHFETYRYVEPLMDAVPWIRSAWEK